MDHPAHIFPEHASLLATITIRVDGAVHCSPPDCLARTLRQRTALFRRIDIPTAGRRIGSIRSGRQALDGGVSTKFEPVEHPCDLAKVNDDVYHCPACGCSFEYRRLTEPTQSDPSR